MKKVQNFINDTSPMIDLKCVKTGCAILDKETGIKLWGDLFHIKDKVFLLRYVVHSASLNENEDDAQLDIKMKEVGSFYEADETLFLDSSSSYGNAILIISETVQNV